MTGEDTFSDLYAVHQGKVSDKWESYLPVYDEAFLPFRTKPVNLLEIGIQNGGSLEVYSKYFQNFSKIIGCDIDPKCAGLTYGPGINVVVGDCNDDGIQQGICNIAPDFDIIIDDGSHTSPDIIKSFLKYFPVLKNGGVFLVEDMHASYWRGWQGGLFYSESSMAFFKALADVINFEHWGVTEGIKDFLELNFSRYAPLIREDMFAEIQSITFCNSICIIKKVAAGRSNRLGHRVVKGTEALVAEQIKGGDNSPSFVMDETGNPWSNFAAQRDGGEGDGQGGVGRNRPCPCGSGKKFKHCHGQMA